MDIPIGKVLHFYENSNSVVIEIIYQLKTGDRIRINGKNTVVQEITVGTESVSQVLPEDTCVIKIPTKANIDDMVYLIGV